MKQQKQIKICDDKIIKKACKKKYKFSGSYKYKQDMKKNQKNYRKNILHKNTFFLWIKKTISLIFKVILFFIILLIIFTLKNII